DAKVVVPHRHLDRDVLLPKDADGEGAVLAVRAHRPRPRLVAVHRQPGARQQFGERFAWRTGRQGQADRHLYFSSIGTSSPSDATGIAPSGVRASSVSPATLMATGRPF